MQRRGFLAKTLAAMAAIPAALLLPKPKSTGETVTYQFADPMHLPLAKPNRNGDLFKDLATMTPLGKNYQLEDTTMYIRREAYMLEFFAYETCVGRIEHVNKRYPGTMADNKQHPNCCDVPCGCPEQCCEEGTVTIDVCDCGCDCCDYECGGAMTPCELQFAVAEGDLPPIKIEIPDTHVGFTEDRIRFVHEGACTIRIDDKGHLFVRGEHFDEDDNYDEVVQEAGKAFVEWMREWGAKVPKAPPKKANVGLPKKIDIDSEMVNISEVIDRLRNHGGV